MSVEAGIAEGFHSYQLYPNLSWDDLARDNPGLVAQTEKWKFGLGDTWRGLQINTPDFMEAVEHVKNLLHQGGRAELLTSKYSDPVVHRALYERAKQQEEYSQKGNPFKKWINIGSIVAAPITGGLSLAANSGIRKGVSNSLKNGDLLKVGGAAAAGVAVGVATGGMSVPASLALPKLSGVNLAGLGSMFGGLGNLAGAFKGMGGGGNADVPAPLQEIGKDLASDFSLSDWLSMAGPGVAPRTTEGALGSAEADTPIRPTDTVQDNSWLMYLVIAAIGVVAVVLMKRR